MHFHGVVVFLFFASNSFELTKHMATIRRRTYLPVFEED